WRRVASESGSRSAQRRRRAGILRQLRVTNMIAVRVTDQDGIHNAQPAIVPATDRTSGIVQNPHAGRIFKQQSSILSAKISGAGSERRDFHGAALRPRKGRSHLDERYPKHQLLKRHRNLLSAKSTSEMLRHCLSV